MGGRGTLLQVPQRILSAEKVFVVLANLLLLDNNQTNKPTNSN